MLGVASLIITLTILDGFEKTIKENVVSFTAHMQLFAFQNQLLSDYDRTMQRVMEKFSEVREISPYVSREGMIRSQADIDGVFIKGVDPANDISAAKSRIVEGTHDLAERDSGLQTIILGRQLANKIGAKIGERVLLFGIGGTSLRLSETRIMQFQVSGIYETGMADYDGSYVYVNIRNAQRLFQIGKTISGFDILVTDVNQVEQLSSQIPDELGYPYYARTMYHLYRNLFTWIELQKKPIPIILGLIIIVATVNIFGTLLMMVMEKSRQIGTLRALGMKGRDLVRVFRTQGVLIGILGTVLGNVSAFGICWLELRYRFIPLPPGIYFMTHVPMELSLFNFGIVSAAALMMCYLASVLPARFASKLDPIEMLRF